MNGLTLEIFDPTIHTRWERQTKKLKDELTNWLVGLFGEYTFDTTKVLKKDGQHMNIVWDQYRVHLEGTLGSPSDDSIKGVERPSGRWKREGSKKSRKDTTRHREVCNAFHNVMVRVIINNFYIEFGTSTNVIPHLIRLAETSKATKSRLDKIGQHKLWPVGYSNFTAWFISIENLILHPNNK